MSSPKEKKTNKRSHNVLGRVICELENRAEQLYIHWAGGMGWWLRRWPSCVGGVAHQQEFKKRLPKELDEIHRPGAGGPVWSPVPRAMTLKIVETESSIAETRSREAQKIGRSSRDARMGEIPRSAIGFRSQTSQLRFLCALKKKKKKKSFDSSAKLGALSTRWIGSSRVDHRAPRVAGAACRPAGRRAAPVALVRPRAGCARVVDGPGLHSPILSQNRRIGSTRPPHLTGRPAGRGRHGVDSGTKESRRSEQRWGRCSAFMIDPSMAVQRAWRHRGRRIERTASGRLTFCWLPEGSPPSATSGRLNNLLASFALELIKTPHEQTPS
ncbi:hypothetical protein SEVIR_8G143350v4 [Setaria viridis]